MEEATGLERSSCQKLRVNLLLLLKTVVPGSKSDGRKSVVRKS